MFCGIGRGMTMHSAIDAADQNSLWDDAAFAANAWRGHAIQIFSQAEFVVSEALEGHCQTNVAGALVGC